MLLAVTSFIFSQPAEIFPILTETASFFQAAVNASLMLKYCFILVYAVCWNTLTASFNRNCTPAVTIAAGDNNICLGTEATLHATVQNQGTNGIFNWKKNNSTVASGNNASYTSSDFREGDVVVCEYYSKTTCAGDTMVLSNVVVMHVVNDITPAITIENNDPLICEGEISTFTATAAYGKGTPSYHWKVNHNAVGTDSPVYSTTTLTSGSLIECQLTVSFPSCPGIIKSQVSQMAIYVYPMIHPQIRIAAGRTEICRGEEVTFRATANGGAFPKFTWKINGITTGGDQPSLTSSSLNNGDVISCMITIDQDSRCHTSTSAPSNEIVMRVRDYPDPSVNIATSTPDFCPKTNVTFTATAKNAGNYSSYQWQVNGHNAGSNSATFVYSQFADSDTVGCILSTDIPGCSITASAASNTLMVTVRKVPVITFTPPEVTVMSGESAQLTASVSGGARLHVWNPGEALVTPQSLTSSTIPLSHNTVFNLSVVGTNGCKASKDVVVKVLHKMLMPSIFTPNKDGKNDVFRIPPGSSFSLQHFSVFDRWGNIVFETSDIAEGWSGTYKSRNLDTGSYVYLIKGFFYDKEVTVKGTVTLLR